MDKNEKAREFFFHANERADVISTHYKTRTFHGVDGLVTCEFPTSPVETCVEHNEGEVIVRFFYAVDRNFDVSPEDLFKDYVKAQGLRFREDIIVSIEAGGIVATVIVIFEDDEQAPAPTPTPEVLAACAEVVRKTQIYADKYRLPACDPDRFTIKTGCGPDHLRSMAWLPINPFTDADFADDDGEDGDAENAFLPPVEIDSDIPERPW